MVEGLEGEGAEVEGEPFEGGVDVAFVYVGAGGGGEGVGGVPLAVRDLGDGG